MCEFFSCLVMRDGSIRWHWNSDSHSELIEHFGLRDDKPFLQAFAKAELTPDWNSDALLDAATWAWRLDEPTRPDWLTDEIEAKAQAAARRVAASFILTSGEKRSILDGAWILGRDARVIGIRGGRIIAVRGNARVRDVRGNAQVHDVRDNAQVHDVRDNAQVHDVRGNAQVHAVRDNAQVRNVWGNAQVRNVWGNAQVHAVRGNAQVRDVGGNAQVHDVRDNAQVRNVWGNAQVHAVRDNAILDDSAKAHMAKAASS